MKLGIVGMLPGDFRTHEPSHFEAIRELGFTGAGFHLPGDIAPEITPADIDRELGFLSDYGIELIQMGVGYGECLFDPDPEIRQEGSRKIINSVKVAAALSARYCLIRPGSLNPEGSWTAHRDNHSDSVWDLFIETLRGIVPVLDEYGVTLVMETHVVSILRNPEACRRMVEEVGSDRLRLVMDYVNHFETLSQVYASKERLDHIFAEMGPYGPVMHVKDISVGKGLVLHLDETVPGKGELDLVHCFRQFEERYPDAYGLIEHLPADLIPEAARNTRSIASQAGVPIK